MKKLLLPISAIALVVLIAWTVTTQMVQAAEPVEAYQPLSPWTNYIPNRAAIVLTNSTGNAPCIIDCSRQRYVAVRLMIQTDDTSTDNINFVLYPSADGSHYARTASHVISVAGVAAGTSVEVVTNLDCAGFHSLKFGYVTNVGTAATANITNFAIGFNYKTQSP